MKRTFTIEFPDDLGDLWMNKSNLLICLTNTCPNTRFTVQDITGDQCDPLPESSGPIGSRNQIAQINELCQQVHEANAKWWVDLETGERLNRNVGELLCLVHSEISEALEGHRKNLMDDKLPHRPMFEVELADAIIRIFDIAAGLGLDLGGAYVEKMAYNATREDHKIESRKLANGKKY